MVRILASAILALRAATRLKPRDDKMKHVLRITFALVLLVAMRAAVAQESGTADDLVGSWTLAAVEKRANGGELERVPGPRGLLVLDGAGHVFEFFSTVSREESEAPQLDPQRTFARFGGFWGRYEADTAAGRIGFEAEAGVSPSVRGLSFSRSYELDGDRLVVMSRNEPQAQRDTRWVWQRMPTVEHLTPAYRKVVGFWQHVEEQRVDETTGDVLSSGRRAPSVIVYTPSGFVGVHFPALGRAPFAGDAPTAEEARAALRGYIGYFGTLGVYPGEVSHNVLAGVSPGTGAILRRYAEITGDELVVRLQRSAALPPGDDPPTVTRVRLRRLSGVDDLLPRSR